jgi:hypothetical protein
MARLAPLSFKMMSASAFAWSPDGTGLAYTGFSGPDHRELQVWTVSVDGSAPSLVASRCCLSDGGGAVWSPDGSQIAFETQYGGGTPPPTSGSSGRQRRRNGRPEGDRRAHVPQLGQRLVLLRLLRVSVYSAYLRGGFPLKVASQPTSPPSSRGRLSSSRRRRSASSAHTRSATCRPRRGWLRR